ncbi:hypothetical protein CONPUDRAFT_138585 [Coniophora puteana RWD-64-598 SS2]|uniref:Uncharacterized protein n=1 Tax=Coniophora puteana (strain RWD-64-598) TaxID=741705 RepID=A0A5M3MGA1_CONPW|nr:uncharacterized protein CONPUDRAFT_138585 [Coniophora puteana RWD-64-598 SS2]EIW78193.1 hypothetical protein CONPUDRAFT_138585 [Coniophora puteana RWD-64-598 SS2]
MDAMLNNERLSLYSIPAMYVLSLVPAVLKNRLVGSQAGWDNVNPRQNLERAVTKNKISAEVAARVRRMEGAHANANEALPLWFAAVLAANYAGVDARTANVASIVFLTLRALHTYTYITQTTRVRSLFRSLAWFGSVGIAIRLLIQAGNKARYT